MLYSYSLKDLTDFWEEKGRQVWINQPQLQTIIDDFFNDVDIKEAYSLLINNCRLLKYDEEDTCDILWWIQLYIYTTRGLRILDDTYWVFNTPSHPFEKFLVQRLSQEGVNPYEAYATVYPSAL